jgi:CxxC-x17-CxxC domain-containing protein
MEESVVAFSDKILTCRECGTTFAFTAGEQEFFAQKGFTNEPGRCPRCRAARRAAQAPSRPEAYGALSDPLAEPRRPREMHETVCAACGGIARVPFLPRGDRPVYCSNCFERERTYR